MEFPAGTDGNGLRKGTAFRKGRDARTDGKSVNRDRTPLKSDRKEAGHGQMDVGILFLDFVLGRFTSLS